MAITGILPGSGGTAIEVDHEIARCDELVSCIRKHILIFLDYLKAALDCHSIRMTVEHVKAIRSNNDVVVGIAADNVVANAPCDFMSNLQCTDFAE